MRRYLSREEVADILGVRSASIASYRYFPEADVTIGNTRGWKESTIEKFMALREDTPRPSAAQVARLTRAESRHYLDRAEFAERIGVTVRTLAGYPLPVPDVQVGNRKGWSPNTVDAWQARRPNARTHTKVG
jgi:predicted DNA-binding transcriptional regulator AlpA